MTAAIRSLYNKSIKLKNLHDLSTDDYQMFKVDILQDVVNEYITYLGLLDVAEKSKDINTTGGDEYEISTLKAQKEYYESQYYSLLTLVGSGLNKTTYNQKRVIDNNGNANIVSIETQEATYPRLIRDIVNALGQSSNKTLYDAVVYYETINNNLWVNLYRLFHAYIYEATYENTDELNSTNLFNQAVIYFEDYNKPNADYSISVLDIGMLDVVDIPRLSVGSKIKIYNKELNLNEYSNSSTESLNNIQFTNNDLIVTSLNYALRNPSEVSINVEKITSYQSILQKLIQSVS